MCKGKSERGRAERIKKAKSLCGICPDKIECAAWALQNNERFGIWGGMTERERTKARNSSGPGLHAVEDIEEEPLEGEAA